MCLSRIAAAHKRGGARATPLTCAAGSTPLPATPGRPPVCWCPAPLPAAQRRPTLPLESGPCAHLQALCLFVPAQLPPRPPVWARRTLLGAPPVHAALLHSVISMALFLHPACPLVVDHDTRTPPLPQILPVCPLCATMAHTPGEAAALLRPPRGQAVLAVPTTARTAASAPLRKSRTVCLITSTSGGARWTSKARPTWPP